MRRFAPLFATTLLGLSTFALPAFAADPQPGQYEMTMQFLLRGSNLPGPPLRFKRCLAAEQIATGNAFSPSDRPDSCKVGKFDLQNGKVSFTFECKDTSGTILTGTAGGTTETNGFRLLMTGRVNPAINDVSDFRQTLHGIRIGDCDSTAAQ